jgi:hypothetical protein
MKLAMKSARPRLLAFAAIVVTIVSQLRLGSIRQWKLVVLPMRMSQAASKPLLRVPPILLDDLHASARAILELQEWEINTLKTSPTKTRVKHLRACLTFAVWELPYFLYTAPRLEQTGDSSRVRSFDPRRLSTPATTSSPSHYKYK